MCGIVGFVSSAFGGGWKQKHDALHSFMTQGLYMDALRGPHATGIMRVNRRNTKADADYYKRALHAYDFMLQPRFEQMLGVLDEAAMVVGHNRYATAGGSAPNNNAHPFQFGDVTMVHNGHVSNAWQLSPVTFSHEVDSAHVALMLAEEQDPIEVLSKLRGAYTLVWHDKRDGSFNVARNEDRPFYWITLGDKQGEWPGIVFASEWEMLMTLVRRNNIPTHGSLFYPEPHHHYKWMLDNPSTFTRTNYTPAKEVGRIVPFTQAGKATESRSTQEKPKQEGGVTAYRGKPTGPLTKDERKWAKRLEKESELNYRQICMLFTEEWLPYPNQRVRKGKKTVRRGCVYGYVEEDRNLPVEIAGVSEDEWEFLSESAHNLPIRILNIGKGYKIDRTFKGEFLCNLTEYVSKRKDELQAPGILLKGPDNRLISGEQWDKLVSSGCSMCTGPIVRSDVGTLAWLGEGGKEPVCKSCATILSCDPVVTSQERMLN